jgi:cytoskeletal protein CcmA (bactofilin family)
MITRTGRVQGNIVAPRVQLEDGSLFRGSIEMNPVQPVENKPAAAKTDAPKSSAKATRTTPSQASSAAAGTVRKEPGLTLKSG